MWNAMVNESGLHNNQGKAKQREPSNNQRTNNERSSDSQGQQCWHTTRPKKGMMTSRNFNFYWNTRIDIEILESSELNTGMLTTLVEEQDVARDA